MTKLRLKFNATRIDNIEKAKGVPLSNCVADTTINNIAFFITQAIVNDDGTVGCKRDEAIKIIDAYIEEKDTTEMILDITEALVEQGFLDRGINIQAMRDSKQKHIEKANETMQG